MAAYDVQYGGVNEELIMGERVCCAVLRVCEPGCWEPPRTERE
jgi:hypothetical protein